MSLRVYTVVGLDAEGCDLLRYEVGTNQRAAVREARDTLRHDEEVLRAGLKRVQVIDDQDAVIEDFEVAA